MNRLIFTIFCLILISCGGSELKKEVANLKSKSIVFPQVYNIMFNGKDSVFSEYLCSKIKLISYVDSISCGSCIVDKMYLWEPYLEYAKLFKDKLKFYFIFSPKAEDLNGVRISLKISPLNYPIMIDTNRDFERLNTHLPKNKALQTFLLDENNNVILVGSPLDNKGIEKLFYNKTQELLAK